MAAVREQKGEEGIDDAAKQSGSHADNKEGVGTR
jgi:hypothetical protein